MSISKKYLTFVLTGSFIINTTFSQIFNPDHNFTVSQLQEDYTALRKLIEDNHPALYRYYDEALFNNFFDSIGSLVTRPMTELEFIKILDPMIAKVHCGHTELWYSEDFEDHVYDDNLFIPFSAYYIQDKAYIRRHYIKDDLPLEGSEIISINGDPVSYILEMLYSGMNGDGFNTQNILYTINTSPVSTLSKYFDYSDRYEIRFIKPGETRTSLLSLKAIKYQGLTDIANKRYLQYSDNSDFKFRILDSLNTAVITISSFVRHQDDHYYEFLKSSFEQIKSQDIRNLIIDVRGNNGGTPDYSIELLRYLMDKDFVYFKTQLNSPECNDPIQPYKNRFNGKIYTLIDGGEVSTTGHFISLLRYHNIGKFVGPESGSTYSCNDNSLHFVLPNTKIRGKVARTTFETAVEGLRRDRGIMPDYYVEPDIEDVTKNKDTILEYALDLISEKEKKRQIIDTCLASFSTYYIYPDKVKEIETFVDNKFIKGEYDSISNPEELTKQLRKDFRSVTSDRHIWIDIIANLPVKDSGATDEEKKKELAENNFGFTEFKILSGNIAYICLDAFVDYKYGKETASEVLKRSADCDAMILDLRNNHGGNENMVRFIASHFFEGKVQLNSLYFRFADSLVTAWTDPGIAKIKLLHQKVFILTSEQTTSAAESFTCIMKNYNRATIIGQNTKGASHWKETYILPEQGIFLEIPVARPVNPVTNTDWEGTGIAPDVLISADMAFDTALTLAKE